ncbi:MAG TPA: YetF domain-containing protein, partial [Longimicrobiales bacterium]|nr:YetF domain-containing protein [Longimicrobiales bacterium]
VLLLFLLASSVRLGLTGHDPSVISALIVAATLFFWDWVIDWLAFRFQSLRWLLRKHPLPLVEEGRVVESTVRRELLTEEDLAGMLRGVGVTSVDEVRHATLEADGSVNVAVRERDGEE